MRLAVVIPASDDPPTLGRCLAALRAGKRRPDELIVQREPAGAGPAAARNAGAQRGAADVLVFVDSDVEVHADALARIEERFRLEPDLCGVFGSYDDEPAASGLTSRFRNLLHHHVHVSGAGEADTFWAGLGAVRRGDFEAVGGFDAETYREPSIEDIALGMKLRATGGRLRLDPAIRGRHLKAWTPLSMVRTDLWRRGVPWTRLLLGQRHRSGALNLGMRHRASAVGALALLVGLIGRRPRLALAALLSMTALNRDFYTLLARRGGPRLLIGGVALHVLHLLTAVASVPVAIVQHLGERGRPRAGVATNRSI
ncbi:MAG TPA: glycosyltransferase family 2 protein [Solirubrobacterales bacterium]|nr:glycosyltransferase family 2 protein [Solirubrobacterales bacterium]